MAQARKKARAEQLLAIRTIGVSDSALAAVLERVQSNPEILEEYSAAPSTFRKKVQAPVREQFEQLSVALQLPLLGGGTMSWQVLDFGLLLRHFVSKSNSYKELLLATVAKHGSTLHLVVVHDEIAAGNVLRSDNRRKFSPFYVAFEEFGLSLQCEYAWLSMAVITHHEVSQVEGGMSCCMRVLLRHLMLGHSSIANGIVIPVEPPKLIFAKLSPMLLDESAVKATFDSKGAAGIKPCLCCKNVVSLNSGLLQCDTSNYLIDITETNTERFDLSANTDIWNILDNLVSQRPQLNAGQFEELCKASGFTMNRYGLLFDHELRPHLPQPLQRWDGMHCLFSHGIAATELVVFLDVCKRQLNITYDDLEQFCNAAWLCRPNCRLDVKGIFSAKREKYSSQDNTWKGTASDLLSIYPLIHEFTERVVRPTALVPDEIASFAAMADIVRLYKRMKRSSSILPEHCAGMKDALGKFGLLHQKAYGTEHIKPKFHYCQHIPQQLSTQRVLVDCFTAERKHRSMKQIANPINITGGFSVAVLSRALANQLAQMPETLCSNVLCKPFCESAEVASMMKVPKAMISKSIDIHHATVSVGDVIISGRRALQVKACVQTHELALVVSVYEFHSMQGSGELWKQTQQGLFSVGTSTLEFVQPSYWCFQDESTLLTLE